MNWKVLGCDKLGLMPSCCPTWTFKPKTISKIGRHASVQPEPREKAASIRVEPADQFGRGAHGAMKTNADMLLIYVRMLTSSEEPCGRLTSGTTSIGPP